MKVGVEEGGVSSQEGKGSKGGTEGRGEKG